MTARIHRVGLGADEHPMIREESGYHQIRLRVPNGTRNLMLVGCSCERWSREYIHEDPWGLFATHGVDALREGQTVELPRRFVAPVMSVLDVFVQID